MQTFVGKQKEKTVTDVVTRIFCLQEGKRQHSIAYFACLFRSVTLTFPRTRVRYNLNRMRNLSKATLKSERLSIQTHKTDLYPFFLGRKASISKNAFVLSLMDSSISAMESSSSGLSFDGGLFSLHLFVVKM